MEARIPDAYRRLSFAFLLSFVFLLSFAGLAAQTPESFRISVDVDLVVLNATVRDRAGQIAPALAQGDFEVYEDGVRQSLRLFGHEDLPVTVGILVDHSGSMKSKINHVIAAARTFVKASNPMDEMFVVNFNEHVRLGLPPAIRLSGKADELARAISVDPAQGQTALYDAMLVGLERLREGGPEKKVLVVISDGGDNASVHKLPEVLKRAGESNAEIYTIGIFDEEDPDRNPAILRKLAETTGGEAFFPGQLDDVVGICQAIARDIRSQYLLGYVSTNSAGRGQRRIRVLARKLHVRTRSAYTR